MKKQILAVVMAAMLLLTGCAGENDVQAGDAPLYVVVAKQYVDENMIFALQEELASLTEYPGISVSCIAMGDPESDPMSAMGGMTKLSTMLASGEIDVLITDEDHARQFGENGEAFVALSKMFTEEEIAAFAGEGVGVPVFDDNGDLTGETSSPCGVMLSDNASALTGLSGLQIHVFDGTKNMDAAKAVVQHLATIE